MRDDEAPDADLSRGELYSREALAAFDMLSSSTNVQASRDGVLVSITMLKAAALGGVRLLILLLG